MVTMKDKFEKLDELYKESQVVMNSERCYQQMIIALSGICREQQQRIEQLEAAMEEVVARHGDTKAPGYDLGDR